MVTRLDTLQKIEIAEGVEIDLRPAGVIVRGGAFILDTLIKWGCYIAFGMLLGPIAAAFNNELGEGVYLGIMTLVVFCSDWIYSIAFEASKMGATPGKKAFKLRVTQLSGAPITFHQAVVRNMVKVVDLLPAAGAIGLISMLSNRRFQRLGDLAAQTVVVYSGDVDMLRMIRTNYQSPIQHQNHEPIRPSVNLSKEEQMAILMYSERAKDWTQPRLEELAVHAGQVVTAGNSRERVNQLHGIAKWIRSNQ